jgi:hypothetical protein
MRLNGRKAILAYLGRSMHNRRGWRKVRDEYAAVRHYLPGSHRVWTTRDDLDALDRARSLTVADIVEGANRGAFGGPVGGYPREYQKALRRILGQGARGERVGGNPRGTASRARHLCEKARARPGCVEGQ